MSSTSGQSHSSENDRAYQKQITNSLVLEETFGKTGAYYEDTALLKNIEGVCRAVLGLEADYPFPYRLHILRNPTLNAFVTPGDIMYVHTGLLARLENEAQLACILGHELTHIRNQHAYKQLKSLDKKVAMAEWLSLIGSIAVGSDAVADLVTQLGLHAIFSISISGFSRELEEEADRTALDLVQSAGYDVREATAFFDAAMKDYGDEGALETFFYGSHPRSLTRKKYIEATIQKKGYADTPSTKGDDKAAYYARFAPILKENARLNIKVGRPLQAHAELERYLAGYPSDSEAILWLGEAYGTAYRTFDKIMKQNKTLKRRGAQPIALLERETCFDSAMSCFRRFADLYPTEPQAFREMGELFEAHGDTPQAMDAYKKYVELQTDTGKVRYIHWKLKKMATSLGGRN